MDYIAEKLGELGTQCTGILHVYAAGFPQHLWHLPHACAFAPTAGNPSAEVRGRALESLEFKWKYGLVRSEDLIQVRWQHQIY
jgi:hypothetical protein